MRQLQKRNQRIDTLRSEARPRKRGRAGRYVYMLFLAFLALVIFDVFLGEFLYLRGNGMVTRDVAVISSAYQGTVREMHVNEGEHVDAGDMIMRAHSQSMTTDIARMSGDLADVEAELATLRTRRTKLKELLPVARARQEKLGAFREQLEELAGSGLANNSALADVIMDSFDARRDVEEMETEAETLAANLTYTRKAAERVREALAGLREIYDNGRVMSPESGIVGRLNVELGSGVSPGERLAEVFHGERHVLAFVPTGAVYDVAPGDPVALRYGLRLIEGRIAELLPVAQRLPEEFQRTFETAQRKQLMRVKVADGIDPPPLFTKVEVTWRTSPRVIALGAIHSVSRGLAAATDWLTRLGRDGFGRL